MNSVNLVGRLGRDPETKQAGDKMVARMSIAVKGGKDQTDWIDVEAWGKTAELAAKYFKKGNNVGISGTIREQKWTTQDGQQRRRLVVMADRVHFVESLRPEATTQQPNYSMANSGNDTNNMNLDDIPF